MTINLHIHGYRRYGIARSDNFICCTSPSCYKIRHWSHILGRYAICPDCFNRYIVLGYQRKHKVLKCHTCTNHVLTESEIFYLARLEEESHKDEMIRIIQRTKDDEKLGGELLGEIIKRTEPETEIIRVEKHPDFERSVDKIKSIDVEIPIERRMTPEQEQQLKIDLEKELNKIAKGEKKSNG